VSKNGSLLFKLLTASAAVSVLAACGGSSGAKSGASSQSTAIVAAYTGAVDSLDPQHTDYGQTNLIDSSLYEALVTYTSDNKLVGALASEYSLSPQATSVAVTLRPGVKFHDGSPLTAADVKFTLDRYTTLGSGIGGLFSSYNSTTVVDDTHLTIDLKAADSLFLGELSKAYIVDSKLVAANSGSDQGQSWLASHDAGTGPYTLQPGGSGGDIVVKRFNDYWGLDPKRPTQITFRRIDQSATQRQEVKAGTVNYANNLSVADMNSLGGSSVKTSKLGVINQQYIYFNTTTGPTANVDVRRALQMAFDYDGALKSILQGAGQIATGPLPLGMSCEATFPAFKQDLPAAKALLAQAGFSSLDLTMRYQPDISDQAQEAVLFQSDLKKIGVNLTLSPITFAEYLKLLSSNSTIPQMILLADNAQIPSAGSFLTQFYGPNSAGSNRSGFSDPQVNALISEAAATSDETVQCNDYTKAQQIIHDAATAVDLFTIPWPLAYTSNLSGVDVSPTVTPISFSTVRVS
jgi:peptide/nickel transport system substrate-binding protein